MCQMCGERNVPVTPMVVNPGERDAGSAICTGHAIYACEDCHSHGECPICYW